MKEGSRGLLMALLLHIPHSSKYIPESYLPYFRLTPETLAYEILKMTDHYTDELFHDPNDDVRRLLFPVSRLLVDPERFADDELEPMTAVGMGCLYSKTHNGQELKNIDEIRSDLLSLYYEKHHEKFENAVSELYKKNGQVLIVDCHSFPKYPLPYELDQKLDRAEICIGTDAYHTPIEISTALVSFFEGANFSVAVDRPFSGSIVPMKYWRKEPEIRSVMIEVRRDLYMNEETGKKSHNFENIKGTMCAAIRKLIDLTS